MDRELAKSQRRMKRAGGMALFAQRFQYFALVLPLVLAGVAVVAVFAFVLWLF